MTAWKLEVDHQTDVCNWSFIPLRSKTLVLRLYKSSWKNKSEICATGVISKNTYQYLTAINDNMLGMEVAYLVGESSPVEVCETSEEKKIFSLKFFGFLLPRR